MKPHPPALDTRQGQAKHGKSNNRVTSSEGGKKRRKQGHVGQKLRSKLKGHTRVMVANIGGLIGERLEEKSMKLKELTLRFQIDILALTELGQNEKRVEEKETLREITRGWTETIATRTSTNIHFDSGQKRLYGGTGLALFDELATRLTQTERDPTGLGRWISTVIQGKQGYKTRIISAYRPCLSNSEASVNIQHHLYFEKSTVDPRMKFIEDLSKAIIEWQNQGELIILAGDMNTGDKKDQRSMENFWASFLSRTGLVNVHQSHLNSQWLPNTQERGTVQIDYIFASPSIEIKRCGFLPFGVIPSDHRGLWVDFSTNSLLGLLPPKIQTMQARRLKLVDPRIVNRYQETLINLVESQDLSNRIEKLFQVPQEAWTNSETQEYQDISKQYREYMILAEKGCRRIFKGKHSWSPEFDLARKKYFLWSLIIRQIKGQKVQVKTIIQLKKKLNIKKTKVGVVTAMKFLSEAKREYRRVKNRSHELRQSYLESLAAALAQENNSKKSSYIKALMDREKLRETFRKIKIARHKIRNNAFSTVTVKDPVTGERRTISEKAEVEDQIMENNQKKFSQTEGKCPLMQGIHREEIGTTANTEIARNIISGNYQPQRKGSKSVQAFYSTCAKPEDLKSTMDYQLSFENYQRQWAKAKERTSSGEAHFGMWKAGARHHYLGRIEWILSIIPIKRGFSPDVWKKATDVMILKASGNTDLDALRTVVLYEADFNFINKQIGKIAVENAAQNGLMVEEQFAKSGSSPIDQCVSRRLIFDLVRFQKASLVMCSTDLLSCYDRIVHSAASLAMQKFGIPAEAMNSMFSTIQECLHKVRTGLGTSEKSYGGIQPGKDPLMGVGQGNGAGPAIWSILSCILFDIMHQNNMSTTFEAKLTESIVDLVGFMYVDDNDLIHSGQSQEKEEVVKTLQSRLKTWEKLIKVTGGAIRIDKSNWYGYYHKWVEADGKYEMTDITDMRLKVKDENGVSTVIPHMPWKSPQEMLGHLATPDGESKHQVEELIQKSKEEAKMITHSRLSPTECKLALTHTIIQKLSFPLISTTITKEEGRRILRPILDACLPKMGLVKTLGYDYIHGSVESQGLGIPDLFHYSCAAKIEFIINHLWKKSLVGELIEMEIQELAIELGIEDPFRPLNQRIWEGLATDNIWIRSVCEYLEDQDMEIKLPIQYHHRRIRENDKYIMEEIADLSKKEMSNKDVRSFNYCRLFKRALTMSEILDSSGTSFSARSWTRERFNRGRNSEFNDLQPPTQDQWKAWEKGLKTLQRKYQYNVGRWTIQKEDELKWDFFVDQGNRRLLLYQNQLWYEFRTLNRRWTGTLKFSKEPIPAVEIQIQQIDRVTIKMQDQHIEIENSTKESLLITTPIETIHQLWQSIPAPNPQEGLEQWIRNNVHRIPEAEWALKKIRFSGDMNKLQKEFSEGKAIMVGDGSLKGSFGAGSSIISTEDGKNYIIASGPTPGISEVQSAYRSEIGSLVGCSLLRAILSMATRSHPQITLACDNEKALRQVGIPRSKVKSSRKHSDLISVLVDSISSIPGKVNIVDVKGHADENKRISELSVVEKLNVEVDKEAKISRERIKENTHRIFSRLIGLGCVMINKVPTNDRHSWRIQEFVSKKRIRMSHARLHNIPEDIRPLIDEKAKATAAKRTPIHQQIFLTKWLAKQLPVGKILKRRQHALEEDCPLCSETVEDINHLLQCGSIPAVANFETQLDSLEAFMADSNTEPTIAAHLIETLRLWRQDKRSNLAGVYPSSIINKKMFQAFSDQQKLGWDRFLEGSIASQWAVIQQDYLNKINETRSTGISWAAKLVKKMWGLLHSVWNTRNEYIHNSENMVEIIHGGQYLQDAIRKEYEQGIQELHKDFKRLFDRQKLDDLLKKPLKNRILWFRTIRLAREKTRSAISDEFSMNGPLRNWIGLPRKKE